MRGALGGSFGFLLLAGRSRVALRTASLRGSGAVFPTIQAAGLPGPSAAGLPYRVSLARRLVVQSWFGA